MSCVIARSHRFPYCTTKLTAVTNFQISHKTNARSFSVTVVALKPPENIISFVLSGTSLYSTLAGW